MERASMGPRLCSRGDCHSRHSLALIEVASMGPRLCSRGDDQLALTTDGEPPSFNGAAAL